MVDRRGTPLAALLGPAHGYDHLMLEAVLDAVPPVRRPGRGRPRRRPAELHGEEAYDDPPLPAVVPGAPDHAAPGPTRGRGQHAPRPAPLGGRAHAGVLAWLNRCRRLTVRYERRADLHQASLTLGCALIGFNQLQRFC